MKLINRGAVIIKPNQLFLDWLNRISLREAEPISFSLDEIQKDCTAFLIPDLVNSDSLDYVLEPMKTSIFEAELSSWYTDPSLWPIDRSPEEFNRWFTLEYHSMAWDVFDLPIRTLDPEDEIVIGDEELSFSESDSLDEDFLTQTRFKRQDSVIVKMGTYEPGKPHNDLSHWRGRIIDFMKSKEGQVLAMVEWDSYTLQEMPAAFVLEHSDQAWDWEALVLNTDVFDPVPPRDSYFRVERIQARLASKYFWGNIADSGPRIAALLSSTDPDENCSILAVWENSLFKRLLFPFEACLERPGQTIGLQKGDFVTVLGLSSIDPLNGVMARVNFNTKIVDVPFSNLIVLSETSVNFEAVEDYKLWFDYTL
jgi:hypothetical protein